MTIFLPARWLRLAFGLALAVLASLGSAARAASFDCSRASTPAEYSVCADPRLSALDDQLAQLYAAARLASKNSAPLLAAQRAWLVRRNTCRSVGCLIEAYEARIAELGGGGGPVPRVAGMEVRLVARGGVLTVPVAINDAITLNFIIDSGATDVVIPADVVLTLLRADTIDENDFLGSRTYVLADGTAVPSRVFRIRSLRVGDRVLRDVTATIGDPRGSLLLGQSFLSRFRSWSVDNTRRVLVLD